MASERVGPFNPFEIPPARQMGAWREVPISESNQPLICLNDLSSNIIVSPQYYLSGIMSASDRIFLRQGAAEKLIQAAAFLPQGFKFIAFDGYRPLEVQQELFSQFSEKLRAENPDRSEEEILHMTETYVSMPSIDPIKPSPHITGGAIDLSIVDSEGIEVDMGTPFDSFDMSSRTDFFKTTNPTYHRNRSILYEAMVRVGFTNYPEEWWHYDFGNQFWGFLNKAHALYGLAKGGENVMERRGELPQEGPFFINLRSSGQGTERQSRLIVGGPTGVSSHINEVREAINQLPDGLGHEELQERASAILDTHRLQRVDF
jgi:D-alanyl-D-alanine dipeptidase